MNTIKIYGLPGVSRIGETGLTGANGINVIYGVAVKTAIPTHQSIFDCIDIEFDSSIEYGFNYNKYTTTPINIKETDKLQVNDSEEDIQIYDLLIDTRFTNPTLYKIYVYNNPETGKKRLIKSELPYEDLTISVSPDIEYNTTYGLLNNGSDIKLYQTLNTNLDAKNLKIYATFDNLSDMNVIKDFDEVFPSTKILSLPFNIASGGDKHHMYVYAIYNINHFKLKEKYLYTLTINV